MTAPNSPAWRELYPFASHEIVLDGHRYHYLDEGNGPPLLLSHGNPTWSFYFRELVRALRDRYRVIVPDHIGCGLSDKPPASRYSYRLAQRVQDMTRLVEHLDLEQITLIAHDWGGAIGMGAAVARPQRFSRFVLMNTAAFRSQDVPGRIRLGHIPFLSQVAVQGLNLFVKEALRLAPHHPERLTPAVKAGLAAPYDSWAHRVGVFRFVQDIPLRPTHPTYATLEHIERGLPQFADHPICLIWGMHDWCFTPKFLDRFLDFFPQAEVHRLPDAGHYLLEDEPQTVVRIVEAFLGREALRH